MFHCIVVFFSEEVFACKSSNWSQLFILFQMGFGAVEAPKVTADGCEGPEVSGPSHRLGLSGANKRMLHLLKKAKVQLIKIDQQKQLKLSQVRNSLFLLMSPSYGLFMLPLISCLCCLQLL